jgi:tRNA (cmo5U34)-methyltransferase
MTQKDFSFADYASEFVDHIGASIPSYAHLIEKCVGLSRRFVQNNTNVVDIGCSTGSMLTSIMKECRRSRKGVTYLGIDIEPGFSAHWKRNETRDLRFQVCDARTFQGLHNISLACSMFALQFIPPPDKLSLLRRVYDGLVVGGSLLISEKVLASTPRLQDALTFPYYDYKISRRFKPKEILDKERTLRGQMTLWTRKELEANIRDAGFREIELIWDSFPFIALIALK